MAAWLDLVNEDESWTLVDTGRLEELVQGMPYPKRQYPCLLYFAGSANRLKALRVLYPHNNVTRKGPAGLVRLHLSVKTGHTENPILFAESSLCLEKSLGDSKWLRHSTKRHRKFTIPDADRLDPPGKLHQKVKTQLIVPWTQVLCLFVDSESDMQSAQNLLQQPLRQLAIGGNPVPTSMQVVIVLTRHEGRDVSAASILANFHKVAETGGLQFSIYVKGAAFPTRSPLNHSETSFMSTYPPFVLSKTLLTVVSRHLISFDLLAQARRGHPRNESMSDCLRESARVLVSSGCSEEDVQEFVVSAFLMDAYPPGMHGFSPTLVFAALYEKHCIEISKDGPSNHHCENISTGFKQQFVQLNPHNTSATIRKDVLRRFFRRWGGLRSTTTCFVCLTRPPEHMMPCEHALCDTCVVIFGKLSSLGEYLWDVAECPVCDEKFVVSIRQLPPTKHPVILSLDGGGIRGLYQLGLLRALEKRIGVPIAVLPDLCLGTSVGALTAIDIFFNNTSVEDCLRAFPDLARRIFRRSRIPVPRFVQWFASAFNLMLTGLYDSANLSQTLKEAVTPERRIFDVATASPAGCRVAVVASRTSDGKACVLANYRGTGQRNANAAYQFLIPNSSQENPSLSDVAMCSVAAPFYFQTRRLPGFVPLQDGGVRANNPLAIALRESSIIWPSSKRHDLLLSVGTGVSTASPDHNSRHGNAWEGALPRLFRAMMSSPSMDGQQGFFEALNYLPHHSKPDVFRLDQAIHGPLPELDDISALEEFSKMDFVVPDELVRTILASAMFFFELDATPVPSHVGYHCEGSILCSRPGAGEILARVLIEIPGAKFQAGQDRPLGDVDPADCCQFCGYFRKRVAFRVASLEERFSINIANSTCCEKIGGFPKSTQDFLDEQQAFAHFGRADHQTPQWPPARHCQCVRDTKRKIRFIEPASGPKRMRL